MGKHQVSIILPHLTSILDDLTQFLAGVYDFLACF